MRCLEEKCSADITILESYISTRKIQQKTTHVRFRYRKPATALLPLSQSLLKIVQLKEKQSAISELEKNRRIPLETVKKAGCTESVLIQVISTLLIIRKIYMVRTISSSLTATTVIQELELTKYGYQTF